MAEEQALGEVGSSALVDPPPEGDLEDGDAATARPAGRPSIAQAGAAGHFGWLAGLVEVDAPGRGVDAG